MRILGRLALIVLVVAAASAMWWLDALRERQPTREADPEARHEPDYYFNDFRMRAHEQSGPPRYVIEGERLVHYADDGTAEVTEPRLSYRGEGDLPWRVRSRRGILSPGADVVDLREDVLMQRSGNERPPLSLRTAQMTVFTEAGRAFTERPVSILTPGRRIDAIGMTARFESGLIEFHREVRGRYDPAIAP